MSDVTRQPTIHFQDSNVVQGWLQIPSNIRLSRSTNPVASSHSQRVWVARASIFKYETDLATCLGYREYLVAQCL